MANCIHRIIFTDILWPDFNKKELNNAIFEFNKRNRRFGKSKLMKKIFLIAILLPILSYNSYAQIRYNMNANDEQIAISYTNPKNTKLLK